MITCDTMTRTKTKNLIFMPVGIMAYLGDSLQTANIPFKVYNWHTFVQTKNPYDIKPEYQMAVEAARAKYEQAGYPCTTCIMAIEAYLDHKEVFEKTLLTFGEHIDPDVKHSIDEYSRQADENEKYYVDDIQYDTCQ